MKKYILSLLTQHFYLTSMKMINRYLKLRPLRRKYLAVILLTLCCLLNGTYLIRKLNSDNQVQQQQPSLRHWKLIQKLQARNGSSKLLPKILLWTPFFGHYELHEYGIFQDALNNCPVKCTFTTDKTHLPTSDAVIFHSGDITSVPIPSVHDPDQIWVFLNSKVPLKTEMIKYYKTIFNWTMTYRSDSDIHYPFGELINKKDKTRYNPQLHSLEKPLEIAQQYLTQDKIQSLIHKPKLAAWIASNCYTHSNRESFVTELQEYIPIDIYGKCGQLICPPGSNFPRTTCYAKIHKLYKFYLSFENSLCDDYVTEKFFNALLFDLVPIVYGGANYSLFAPKDSFIDASSFKSTKELADYIIYLSKNHGEFLKYYRWKDFYKVEESKGWCELCRRLHNFKPDEQRKHYEDIEQWWMYKPKTSDSDLKPACRNIPVFPNERLYGKLARFFL